MLTFYFIAFSVLHLRLLHCLLPVVGGIKNNTCIENSMFVFDTPTLVF
jgi:hypothetical protein